MAQVERNTSVSYSKMPTSNTDPFTVLPPGVTLDGRNESFFNVGGIPQGEANNPLDRYGFGALLQAALARSQLSAALPNQFNAFQNTADPLEAQFRQIQSTDFAGLLGGSALASTSGAVSSALAASRAASGRGGFSVQNAIRAATEAGVGQSAAVANALTQGTLGKLQLGSETANALSGARYNRASALANLYGSESQLSFNIAQLLAGIAAPGGQVAAAGINKDAQVQSSLIGALGNVYSSAITAAL